MFNTVAIYALVCLLLPLAFSVTTGCPESILEHLQHNTPPTFYIISNIEYSLFMITLPEFVEEYYFYISDTKGTLKHVMHDVFPSSGPRNASSRIVTASIPSADAADLDPVPWNPLVLKLAYMNGTEQSSCYTVQLLALGQQRFPDDFVNLTTITAGYAAHLAMVPAAFNKGVQLTASAVVRLQNSFAKTVQDRCQTLDGSPSQNATLTLQAGMPSLATFYADLYVGYQIKLYLNVAMPASWKSVIQNATVPLRFTCDRLASKLKIPPCAECCLQQSTFQREILSKPH